MRFFILSTALLIIGIQCGYPVAQNSYPTPPPPSDSYVVPKPSYPTAPGAYATKHGYGPRSNSAPVAPPPPPPPPSPVSSVYNSEDVSVTAHAEPPAPPTDAQFAASPSISNHGGGSAPTYGGSLSSGVIAGGSSLSYGNYNSAVSSPGTASASDSVSGGGASSGYRRRAKAKARARARARTVTNRRFHQRRQLQPIRRFHKKAKH